MSFIQALGVFISVIGAIQSDYKICKEKEISFIEKVLSNKKTVGVVMDYCRRSYNSEMLLCAKDIDVFLTSRKKTTRLKIGEHIAHTYLRVNSPLELNISNISVWFSDVSVALAESNDDKVEEILQEVRIHCLHDLKEVIYRLCSINDQVLKVVTDHHKTQKDLSLV